MARMKEEAGAGRKKTAPGEPVKGPDLEGYLEGRRRKFITYAQGARMFTMNYYSFVRLAKTAGANLKIKKKVIVDLDAVEAYLMRNRKGGSADEET